MKISILCADLSSNCLGRSYILARVLERHYRVEIVGPAFGDGIWEPLAGEVFDYRAFPMALTAASLPDLRKLADWVDGDYIYANKPLATSFGVGLWARLIRPRDCPDLRLRAPTFRCTFSHYRPRIAAVKLRRLGRARGVAVALGSWARSVRR